MNWVVKWLAVSLCLTAVGMGILMLSWHVTRSANVKLNNYVGSLLESTRDNSEKKPVQVDLASTVRTFNILSVLGVILFFIGLLVASIGAVAWAKPGLFMKDAIAGRRSVVVAEEGCGSRAD